METQGNKLLKKSQNKVDFYAKTCKKGDEWILHFNGQDGFGFYWKNLCQGTFVLLHFVYGTETWNVT
jgi:hypothetical protein